MVTEEELKNMSPEEIADLQKKNCIFCQIVSGNVPGKKIYEDSNLLAILDINPATKGHVVVLTKEHYVIMPQVPDSIVDEMARVAKFISHNFLKALAVNGSTIFVANGVVAGQKAPHLLMHIIPRIDNDGVKLNIKDANPDPNVSQLQQRLQPFINKAFGLAAAQTKPNKEDSKPQIQENQSNEPDDGPEEKEAQDVKDDDSEENNKVSLDDISDILGGKNS